MYVVLATLKQFNFCYLLRFNIIPSVHGASLMRMRKTLDLKRFLLRKSLESFETCIVKKLKKFQYCAKNIPYKRNV